MLSTSNFFNLYNYNDLKLIRSCRHGPKVLETATGEVIKVFYPKRWRSSNTYWPYAKRFSANAKHLSALHIKVPRVNTLYFCPKLNTYFVSYDKLPGEDVYSIVKQGNDNILYDILRYVSMLHEKGIFFRALHLSNLLYQKNNTFALIDITDVKKQRKPLSLYKRYRNLKHLFLHKDDIVLWSKLGIEKCLEQYCQFAGLSFISKKLLMGYFSYRHLTRHSAP